MKMQLNLHNAVPFILPVYLYSSEYIVLSILNPSLSILAKLVIQLICRNTKVLLIL